MTAIAIVTQRREYAHKKAIDYSFVPGDFKCTVRNVIELPIFAFAVGFITAMSGIGPGIMLNTFLLRLDVHPIVAVETGQILGSYVAVGATICMIIYQ